MQRVALSNLRIVYIISLENGFLFRKSTEIHLLKEFYGAPIEEPALKSSTEK